MRHNRFATAARGTASAHLKSEWVIERAHNINLPERHGYWYAAGPRSRHPIAAAFAVVCAMQGLTNVSNEMNRNASARTGAAS
jgi:hypothetical protein